MDYEQCVDKITNILNSVSIEDREIIIKKVLSKIKNNSISDSLIIGDKIHCHAFTKDKLIEKDIFDDKPFVIEKLDGCYASKYSSLSADYDISPINKTNSIINIANN